ncbi:MAG: hypothetical protein R6V12_18345 [Candidatus Hydrogenedentota bacterium]
MDDWKFDLAHYGRERRLRAGYWEVNIMCHIVNHFKSDAPQVGTYENLYNMPVAASNGAIDRFKEAIENIPKDQLKTPTKKKISKKLEELREVFREQYPNKMILVRDLYTWYENEEPPHPDILRVLEEIQTLVETDTKKQKDAHGNHRFTRGCKLCLPFLDVLKDPDHPIDKDAMETHIENLGEYSLQDLYKKRRAHMSSPKKAAISAAKKNGIFSRAGNPCAFLGSGQRSEEYRGEDPGNDLICIEDTCQPNTDTFCSTAEEGGCSAMSDSPESSDD